MSLSPFVGRLDELAALDTAVALAREGRPQCVVVGGEAGVGKTRLVEHWAGRAAESGAEVLTGRCVELGAYGTPLAPFRGVVRDIVDRRGAAALADLVPDGDLLVRLLPDMATSKRHRERRGGLFEAFGAVLQRLGRERPTLLVLDDVQWADRSSRELLGFLVRTLRSADVTMIVAFRSDDLAARHPLRGFLAELGRLSSVHQMELRRFNRIETAELLAGAVGDRPSPERIEQIYRRSCGNALFTEELARTADPDSVPSSLRDLLTRGLDRLPEDARDVVSIAALGDRVVPHALLANAAGLAEEGLIDALRLAVDARVLVPERDGYVFRHPLLRAAVAQDLLPAHRRLLHRRCAEALDADPGLVAPDRFPAEIAFHWHEAGVRDKAFSALLEAATAAQKVFGYAEQAELLERALTLEPSQRGLCDLYDAAITAASWAGDPVRALRLIHGALEVVDPIDDPQRTALLHVQHALALLNLGAPGAAEAIELAAKSLPDQQSVEWVRVLDQLAMAQVLNGSPEQARETAAAGVRLADELGAADLTIGPRTILGWALTELGDYAGAVETLRDAQRRSGASESGLIQVRLHINLAKALQGLAEHGTAIDTARNGLHAARIAGLHRALGGALHMVLVESLVATGRWDEAETAAARALETDPTPRYVVALQTTLAMLALSRGELDTAHGRLATAEGLLGDPAEALPETVLLTRRAAAELALAEGRTVDAAVAVTDGLRSASAGPPPLVWALLTTGAAAATALPSQSDGVEALCRVASGLRTDAPVVAAYAAQFAAELGSGAWTDVVAAWLAAGDDFRAGHARLHAARDALAAGDRAAAGDLLRAAVADASRLGAAPLLAEITLTARTGRISLDVIERASADGRRQALGLTPRETDILLLVAEGRSNRQIADELFISAKTVSVHVSHILAKFGVRTRGEAAAAAHRMRLIDG